MALSTGHLMRMCFHPSFYHLNELLEFNVKDFGYQHQHRLWELEVTKFETEKFHKVYFFRPERKGDKDSVRKRNVATRKYGCKKRVDVSDKPLDLSAPRIVDEPEAIDLKIEELDVVDVVVNVSVGSIDDDMLVVASANDDVVLIGVNNDVVVADVNDDVEFDIIAEVRSEPLATETRSADNTNEMVQEDADRDKKLLKVKDLESINVSF